MLPPKNDSQFINASGEILPWYTKPFLDELVTWDLLNKSVYEYGLGWSSIWFSNRVKLLHGVDDSVEWYADVVNELQTRSLRASMDFRTGCKDYIDNIKERGCKYDIVIVDGYQYRDECIEGAIPYIIPGGKLIVDNWLQPSVWVALEKTQVLLSKYETKVYPQQGHPDWKTACFTIA